MSKTTIHLLPVREVAEQLSVSEATVWRLLHRGELPRTKVANATRISADAVAAFVADQLPEPARRTRRRSG